MSQLRADKSSGKKVLFVSLQGIGDLVMSLPAIRIAKEGLALSRIYVLTFKKNKEVITNVTEIEKIFTVDIQDKNAYIIFIELIKLVLTLRKERIDIAICAYPTGLRSAVVAYLSGAKTRFGQKLWALRKFSFLFTHKVTVEQVKHAVELNIDLLRPLEIDVDIFERDMSLHISDNERKFILEFKEKNSIKSSDLFICIHPGAGKWGKSRLWPYENFIQLTKRLIDELKARVVIIGSFNEEPIINKISSALSNQPIPFLNMPLNIITALLEACDLFIGNNSGPMHISAAVNTATIGLFGDTDPLVHGPYGYNNVIVRAGIDCSPCYYPHLHGTLSCAPIGKGVVRRKFKCSRGGYECMKNLSVYQVYNAAVIVLKKQEKRKN
ncbi:MAG: glycosyltransferase family 9 protein [Candidatus Omnitrophica bacterium]|nr:glycosyltransferase family 9 protein [Candidatus Omnitrophota bacterium]